MQQNNFQQSGKSPRDYHIGISGHSNMRTNKQKKLTLGDKEKMENFIQMPVVSEFINAEKKKRKKPYYKARHIISIAPLGSTFNEMTHGYDIFKYKDFELDSCLVFIEDNHTSISKQFKSIEKAIQNQQDKNYLFDCYQALVCWEEEHSIDSVSIVPLSFCDKRLAFILILDCPIIREASLKMVLLDALNHYNKNYLPKITVGELNKLNQLYKSNVGKVNANDFSIFQQKFLRAYLYNDSFNYFLFNDGIKYEAIEEKEALNHPTVDFSWTSVKDNKLVRIKTPYKNKELMIRGYKRNSKRSNMRLSKNQKRMIKEYSWSNNYCIKHTLKSKKIYVKNNVAKKLSKIDFKIEYQTMTSYNQILEKFNCRFVFNQCSHQSLDLKSQIAADILVVKKLRTYSSFHMIPLRKGKLEEETLNTNFFENSSNDEIFLVYEYYLETIHNDLKEVKKKCGKRWTFKI